MFRDQTIAAENGWRRIFAVADDARVTMALLAIPLMVIGVAVLPTGPAITLALALYAIAGGMVLYFAVRTGNMQRFGPANRVTWLRTGLTTIIAGALAVADTPALLNWWIIGALAGAALALDGLDGWLARHHAVSCPFGARFDMETDAALILVLSLLIGVSDKTGLWIIAAGALRYVFVAAGRVWPVLTKPLPPSNRRRAVCAIQVGALLACLLPVVTNDMATVIGGMALAILCLSFGRDILWLLHRPLNQNTD